MEAALPVLVFLGVILAPPVILALGKGSIADELRNCEIEEGNYND